MFRVVSQPEVTQDCGAGCGGHGFRVKQLEPRAGRRRWDVAAADRSVRAEMWNLEGVARRTWRSHGNPGGKSGGEGFHKEAFFSFLPRLR